MKKKISRLPIPGLRPVLIIIFAIVISWVLIHLLSIFGVLLAVAYPLWWFLIPARAPCFFCRTTKEGLRCFSCRQVIQKADCLCPKNFRSAFINAALVLACSVVCVAFVFAESNILFKLGFPPTPETVSFVIPSQGQYRLDEIFPMEIEIAGIQTPINAVQADLGFDPQKLEVVDISTEDSFANIFIQKEINNEAGYARLTGGLPNPGFFADHGFFATVFFKGISPGIVEVEFLPSSMVLANDGLGTNTLKDLASVSYLILAERISEEEAEMQEGIVIESVVLGETSEDTQMTFYEEGKILGEKVEQEEEEDTKFNVITAFLDGLEKVDRFVLTLWDKVFSLFR